MDLVEKYIGEGKSYVHVIEDDGEHNLVHSTHDHPRLGGQQLKSFKGVSANVRRQAVQFALKNKKKDEIVMTWKKVGQGYRAEWLKGGTYTKLIGEGSGGYKYLGEAKPKVDLRKNYDEVVKVNSKTDKSKGTLYRKGNVVQMWWDTDVLGRKQKQGNETWTNPDEKQAKRNFKDMKVRFSE